MNNAQPLSPEILVPLMGEYLVEKGLITAEDLSRALAYQVGLRQKNEDRLLGQILVDLGIIDRETRDTTITELILQLKAALQEANQQLVEANQQLEQRVKDRTAELQKALAKLSELNQLKANIVANISHELRTPLTHLKGYLDLLLAGDLGSLNEQQHSALTIIERSSDRLGRLIEDLLLFSVSQRDQLHLSLEPLELQVLSLSAIHKTKLKAKERNIKLVYDCDEKLPQVEGDEEKISWVILQLLDNAIKFTQPGGSVTLRIRTQDSMVNIMVLDTGIGIPNSHTDEIFDSFYQLDGSTTRRAGGTGLGLALAKNIIEAHGSMIQVTSDVGKGSCFAFFLKIYQGSSSD
jgi:signal transduction histidine kinase